MTTRAPNEETPRQPDADGARNDVGIDPEGQVPGDTAEHSGTANDQGTDSEKGTAGGDSSTPQGNDFSPNFEPEQDEEKLTKPKDADIDTDGG